MHTMHTMHNIDRTPTVILAFFPYRTRVPYRPFMRDKIG